MPQIFPELVAPKTRMHMDREPYVLENEVSGPSKIDGAMMRPQLGRFG